jgi:4-amino-4-deoxy-L-arabinose transferase-like glycosyltransferase
MLNYTFQIPSQNIMQISFDRQLTQLIDRYTIPILIISSLLLWLILLGNVPLKDWDEGTYALIAREIIRTGDWIYLKIQGDPFLLKPPLGMWTIAFAYQIGGISEFTTRLPCAILTAIGVPILYQISYLLFDRKTPALLSALVYLTLLPVVRHGRLAMLDGMLITFWLLSLLCLLQSRQNRRWSIGIGLMLGLITLTKGLLVIVFGLIVLLILIATGQISLLKSPYLWLGLIIGQIPAIAWYLAQYHQYGDTFVQVHFFAQSFDRLSQSVEDHQGPIWFYAFDIIEYTFPWLLFIPGGIVLAWRNSQQNWARFALIGGVVYFSIVSLMKTKLNWYIMPVYPFLAVFAGAYLSLIWQGEKPIYTMARFGWLSFAAFAGIVGCGYFAIVERDPILVLMSLSLAISMGLAAALVKQQNKLFIPTLFVGMYLVLFGLMSSHSWIWEINSDFQVQPVGQLIHQHVARDSKVYSSLPGGRPSLDFYSDAKIEPTPLDRLPQLLVQHQTILIDRQLLLKSASVPENQQFQQPYQILGQTERFALIKSHQQQ